MSKYLIYLRKSRKDQDLELATGVHDTLQRHRDALLALAERMHLPIAGIFEEVVSGDTIAERPEMQKLLETVETGEYAGVLVMEVPRLARGNTRDQGVVAETFQYTGTKIITPDKIYDPADESDEEYFEFGLFMSRREYKAIKRRLQRGRMASLKEGKYIAGTAPYGYEKYKLPRQRGYSLREIPSEADVVRRIFHLYTVGLDRPMGSFIIANELNREGIPAPSGGRWSASSVRDIVKNPVYAGYVRWAYRPLSHRMVGGEVVTSCPVNHTAMITNGMHEGIIDANTWKAAQCIRAGRSHAPIPGNRTVANPLAGLLYCSVCGRSMVQLPHGSKLGPTLTCPTPGCCTVSSRLDVVENELLRGLAAWLEQYRISCSPDRAADVRSARTAARAVARLEESVATLERQRDRLYDLLEQGVYTQEVFLERSRLLADKITVAQGALTAAGYDADHRRAEAEDRENLIPKIQNILDNYWDVESAQERNRLLKEVLNRVIYKKSVGGRWVKSDMRLYIFPRVSVESDHL
ncbi:MAG: recombinase family protein [Intestinimonas sp.]|jgi:DNA invertase Pin-like site-specific DNA recombinase|nr:recombinase family protein [Intestinimonas sp.]